jgi:hypothetical protein
MLCVCFSFIGSVFKGPSSLQPTAVDVASIQTEAVQTALAGAPRTDPTKERVSLIPSTETPIPLPADTETPPALAMSMTQFVDKYDSLTDIQKKGFIEQSTGKFVNWSGQIIDVHSDGTISIDIPGTLASSVTVKGISQEEAIKLTKGSTIHYTGRITDILDLLGLHISIEDAQLSTEASSASDTQQPSPTDISSPATNIGKIGERVEASGIAITVKGISRANTLLDVMKPKSGNVFLIIDVLIENVSRDEKAPYNPLYFKIKDSEGFEYDITFVSPDPSLSSGELIKGDKARGNIAIEIKANATGLILTYKPITFDDYTPISINLGQ